MLFHEVVEIYNNTYHRSTKTKPIVVHEGKKDNPIERKVNESVMKKGMIVRFKTKIIFDKGDVATLSRYIYQIIGKKQRNNTLKNLNTTTGLKRTYIE